MDVLKNCWAWVEKAPVAMAVTAVKSESTVLALKLKKSVRNARDALMTAGSWVGPPPLLVAKRTPKTSVPTRPTAATRVITRKARRGTGWSPPERRGAERRG